MALQTLHLRWLQQHPGEGKCVELVCSSAWAELLQLKPAFTVVHQGENLDHHICVKQMFAAIIVHHLPRSQNNCSEVLVITLAGRILIPTRLKRLLA